MKIGRNMWDRPLIATGISPFSKRKYLEINPGGRWVSALWIFGRELILAFNIPLFCGTIHWHVGWGWKPEVKKIEFDNEDRAGS
jgi:hypothetical protein